MRLASVQIGGNEAAAVLWAGGALPVAELPNPGGWPTDLLSLLEGGRLEDLRRGWDGLSGRGEEADYGDLLSSFSAGLASIEGFVNHMSEPRRDRLPRGDEPDHKVSLDFKLNNWIPALSVGQPINKKEKYWQDFREIRRVRNERESHPKTAVYPISGTIFCKQLNQWRTGVALMLLALHAMTGRLAPPELVKAAYMPDIELMRG